MNLFASINEGLKTVHKNYQILFIHFAFLFLAFFGLFFVLSIPLGILFVVFGIDLTDILKGSFIEIVFSSIKLFKKFLILAIVLILSLLIYVILVLSTWIYIFSGTLGVMYSYLSSGELFKIKIFHFFGKNFFWRVSFYSFFSLILLIIISLILGIVSDISTYLVKFIKPHSHSISVFFSVFLYLSILILALALFIFWLSITMLGYYIIIVKNFKATQALKEAKNMIFSNPQCLTRSFLLFVIYLLTGGFILSFSSLLAIIPGLGTFLAAIYHIVTQFAHVYITMVLFASFFSYYLKLTETLQTVSEDSGTSQSVLEQEQSPHQEDNPQQSQNQIS